MMNVLTKFRHLKAAEGMAVTLAVSLLLLYTPSVYAQDPYAENAGQKAITLMIYMCGSNLESRNCAGSQDLMEIMRSGYDEESVNVLILTGGTRRWGLSVPNDALCIYTPRGGELQMVDAFSQADMGTPEVLAAFLDYCHGAYPADRYALIMWDHGGGPLNGVCMDENYDFDSLSLDELCAALQESPFGETPLDWIGFDACLMASAEVGVALMPYARYMIASEETEPGGGWDYSFLKGIENDKDAVDTAPRIMDGYFDSAKDSSQLTLSCVDLSGTVSVRDAMDPFFSSLSVSSGNYALFSYAAANTRAYGRAADSSGSFDLIDLGVLTDMLKAQAPREADSLLKALDEAVVLTRSGDASQGLSVYHPYENRTDYLEKWYSTYPALFFSEGYADYIARFAGYLFGESDVAWDGLSASPTTEENVYALPLSEGQQELVASADMQILQWDKEKNAYACVGSINQLAMEDGVLYGAWGGQTLRAVNEDGTVTAGSIPYEASPDGTFTVRVNYCMENADSSQDASMTPSASESGPLRSSFGSYSFDTVATGSSSLSDLMQETPLQAETLSPIDMSQTDTLIIPSSSSLAEALQTGASPVSEAGWTAWSDDAFTSGSAAAITPVALDLFSDAVSPADQTSAGSAVDTSALVPIGTSAFTEDQIAVSADSFNPPSQETDGQPQVIQALLTCSADDSGNITVLETSLFDTQTGEWSTRGAVDETLYPLAAFPVTWKQPASSDHALVGFENWADQSSTVITVSSGSLRLSFTPQEQDDQGGKDLCVSFQVKDIQNQTHSSLPLKMPASY